MNEQFKIKDVENMAEIKDYRASLNKHNSTLTARRAALHAIDAALDDIAYNTMRDYVTIDDVDAELDRLTSYSCDAAEAHEYAKNFLYSSKKIGE
jgi:hypothetical protein